MRFPSWLDWIGFFPQIFPANHPLLYPLKVVFLGQVKSPNFLQISLSQADKGFPAFSYTEFLAATFDRSRHSTEAVPWPWATQRALAHRAESNKKRVAFPWREVNEEQNLIQDVQDIWLKDVEEYGSPISYGNLSALSPKKSEKDKNILFQQKMQGLNWQWLDPLWDRAGISLAIVEVRSPWSISVSTCLWSPWPTNAKFVAKLLNSHLLHNYIYSIIIIVRLVQQWIHHWFNSSCIIASWIPRNF